MNEYFYRSYLRRPFKTLMWVLTYVGCSLAVPGIITYINIIPNSYSGNLCMYSLVSIIIMILMVIIFFIAYGLGVKNLKYKSFVVGEKNFIYKYGEKTYVFPYTDIENVEMSQIKYNRGWINLKFKEGTIRLNVKIEKIGDLIKDLKDRLDKNGLQNKYDKIKIENVYKTACYSDDSWARFHEIVYAVPPSLGICIILSFIISFLTESLSDKLFLSYMLFLYPILVLIFAELILALKFNKQMAKENFVLRERKYHLERRVYKIAYFIIFIVLLFLFIIILRTE